MSCSNAKWLIILENALEGLRGDNLGENWAVSLAGNDGAGRGWWRNVMVERFCYGDTLIEVCEFKSLRWSIQFSEEGRCWFFFVVGRTRVLGAAIWQTLSLCLENEDL